MFIRCFFEEKTCQILLTGKPHMLQILFSSVRVKVESVQHLVSCYSCVPVIKQLEAGCLLYSTPLFIFQNSYRYWSIFRFRFLILHIAITTGEWFWWYFDHHIINPLITTATKEEMLITVFQEKVSIRFFLIWLICSAMSAYDLTNFWEQTK